MERKGNHMEFDFSATRDKEIFELQVFEQAMDWVIDAGNMIKGN